MSKVQENAVDEERVNLAELKASMDECEKNRQLLSDEQNTDSLILALERNLFEGKRLIYQLCCSNSNIHINGFGQHLIPYNQWALDALLSMKYLLYSNKKSK